MIAKIISVVLAILQVVFSYVSFDYTLVVDEVKKDYPFVLCHGFFGWNENDGIREEISYWGCFAGSIADYLNEKGCECYEAASGCVSSAWDRSCELYAQLTGTRVDYGKVHSEKYGHERYGKTYDKPLFEGWGKDKKVNLISHSFGGNTVRLFSSLLADGCKEEVEATKDGTLSGLFTGGKEDYIYSITTFATPHNGTTITDVLNTRKGSDTLKFAYEVFAKASKSSVNDLYTTDIDSWDVFDIVDGEYVINEQKLQHVINSEDLGIYDTTLEGAKKANERIDTYSNIYYFSYALCCTSNVKGTSICIPNESCAALRPFSYMMGCYTGKAIGGELDIDESWFPNDGLVNTISALYPFDENHKDFDKNNIEKGIWQVMPIVEGDHFLIMFGKENDFNGAKNLSKLFVELVNTIISTY